VVLRPTKSVSVLYGLGDPATGRAVLQAHHAGIREAVGYLDEHLVGLCQVGARDLLGRPSQRGAGRRQRGQAPAQQASRT
jgi:hypothetical protein